MALGKLSAGLAHELNNPAAAVRSAAMSLKEAVHNLRSAQLRLDKRAEIARRAMLAVEDDTDVAVITDRHSTAKIVCGCHKSR